MTEMANIMTPREVHAENLSFIAETSKSEYYRRMTFKEAAEWIYAFECERDEGYPRDMAAQRAWDCYFAARRWLVTE